MTLGPPLPVGLRPHLTTPSQPGTSFPDRAFTPPPLDLSKIPRTIDDSEDPSSAKRMGLIGRTSPTASELPGVPSPSGSGHGLTLSSASSSTTEAPSPTSPKTSGLLRRKSSGRIALISPRPTFQHSSPASSSQNNTCSFIMTSLSEQGASSSNYDNLMTPRTPKKTSPRYFQPYDPSAVETLIQKCNILKNIDSSKSAKKRRIDEFNGALKREILDRISQSSVGHFTPELVDRLMLSLIEKKVTNFCGNVRDFSGVSKEDLRIVKDNIHQRILNKLEQHNQWTNWFIDRVLKLNELVVGIVESKKQKSNWTDELFHRIKRIYAKLLENNTPNDCIDYVLQIPEQNIRSIVLSSLNPDEFVAQRSLERMRVWNWPDHLNMLIKKEISRLFKIYINTPKLLEKALSLKFISHPTKAIESLIERVDIQQVARSFIHGPNPIYTSVIINGEAMDQGGLTGDLQACQTQYFNRVFEKIHRHNPSLSPEDINQMTSSFLNGNPVPGLALLTLASNNGWSICDSMIKELFPGLFAGDYRTRMQLGYACEIDADESKNQIVSERTLYVFQGNSDDRDSFTVDSTKPLVALGIRWYVYSEPSEKGLIWTSVISFNHITRFQDSSGKFHSTDEQWHDILRSIRNYSPIPGLRLLRPKNEILIQALKNTN